MTTKTSLYILVAAMLVHAPASALDFSFSYAGSGSDAVGTPTAVAANGTLTTTDTTTQVNGRAAYTVTGIAGTRNGATIDQLFAPGTPLDMQGNVNDNYLFVSGDRFTFNGIAFGVDGTDDIYNLYFNSGYDEFVSGPASGPFGLEDNGPLAFTLTPLAGPASPAPEPATWATMILGFGLVGQATRRRRGRAVLA